MVLTVPVLATQTQRIGRIKTPSRRQLQGVTGFADQVAYMDKLVGRIVDHLDVLGLRDNTLVIVCGDNGTDTPIVSEMADGSSIAGAKGLTTDGGTRVPLIMVPGTISSGL